MLQLPDSWVWDFWTINRDGQCHLFFLFASRALHDPDARHLRAAVGHAVSRDLVTWERLADALVAGPQGAFDDAAIWTGSVIDGNDGLFHMFYTGAHLEALPTHHPGDHRMGIRQQIGHATSTDLITWTKLPGPILSADARWYELLGDGWPDEHFRDPWVLKDPAGDGWHLLVTARAKEGSVDDRGVVGHARSRDLYTWQAEPPLSTPDQGFGQLEVLQPVQLRGKDFLLFNCLSSEYAHHRSSDRPGAVWLARAESPLGPYDIAHAVALYDEDHYVGKLVEHPTTGEPSLLAFVNKATDGTFVGAISNPLPLEQRLAQHPGLFD